MRPDSIKQFLNWLRATRGIVHRFLHCPPPCHSVSRTELLIRYAQSDVESAGVREERECAQTQRICTQVHALDLCGGMFTRYERPCCHTHTYGNKAVECSETKTSSSPSLGSVSGLPGDSD